MNGLTCGTTYTVGVKALDSAGNTSPPATTTITTSSCATGRFAVDRLPGCVEHRRPGGARC